MPSPIGHMLGGVIAGWAMSPRPDAPSDGWSRDSWRRPEWRQAAWFAAIGAAPDLDLLFGTHSTYTHSVGAVALTALVVYARGRGTRPRHALACAAAVASHILLDWLGSDTTPPIGIMALWPFTHQFYQSPFFVFMAITRRWWLPQFYTWNIVAALREIVILAPVAILVAQARRHSERGIRSE